VEFSKHIVQWYNKNQRNLPWRTSKDPYKIWISEIILQQTRVAQGISYYNNFVNAFPNISALAEANEEDVLKLWQGLGYYSRARNIHFTAKYIKKELNGRFPDQYRELLKLKGIGPYTAAAISSICFDEERAAVDGNVYRVLARVF
jgi:A/G-specific adenine glycosylase